MYADESSEQGPRGTFEIYRAEGDSLYKNGEYRKAIESYTTALELQNDSKDCLVARSRCYLQLGEVERALQDAQTSLTEEPNFHKGLYQKAEALYCKGEFELALMFYHRGHKLRPELKEFRLGIQKAQEAIDNSVGSPDKVQLTKEGDLAYFEQQANEKQTKGKRQPNYRQTQRVESRKQKREPPKSASNDKSIKQLLGELYGDRMYLEKLLKETDSNSDTGRTIYDLVCDGLHYLDTRTEFWRQQKPMYARRRERQRTSGASGGKDKDSVNKFVIAEMEKIDEEQAEGKFKESLKRARKCMKTVDGYNDETIRDRTEVIANLHSYIGNAHLELGNMDKAMESHNTDLEIAKQNNLTEAQSRAYDNLGRVYARTGQFQKAIDCWESKLPMSQSALESTWLHHEIGRCHLEMGNHDEAKASGDKSIQAAVESGDEMWQLNATVLVAQSEVKLEDYNGALSSFEKALDLAKIQGDRAAEDAIKKAITDTNNKIVQGIKNDSSRDEGGASPEPQQERENSPEPREKTPEPREPTPEPQNTEPEQNTEPDNTEPDNTDQTTQPKQDTEEA